MIDRKRVSVAAGAALGLVLAAVAPARAADPATGPTYGAPATPEIVDEGGLPFGIVAGGYAFVTPVYEGSDEYTVTAFPLVYPKFYGDGPGLGDRLTLRGLDDVRFALFKQGGFEFGPVGGYTFGRQEDEAALLDGLGDVDDGLILGAYAGYGIEPFFFDVAYSRQVTGEDDAGYQIDMTGGAETALSEQLALTTSVTAAFASDDYLDTYFGVTPGRSASSGLDAYDPDGGFKSVGVDLALEYQFTERAALRTSVGYSRLLGDAADSPVTASSDQFRGGFGFTYSFGRVE